MRFRLRAFLLGVSRKRTRLLARLAGASLIRVRLLTLLPGASLIRTRLFAFLAGTSLIRTRLPAPLSSVSRTRTRLLAPLLGATLALLNLPAALPAHGYETDPYSERLHPVADALPLLDRLVNRALREVEREWSGPRNDMALARAVYDRLGGHYWVDWLERISVEHPQLQRLPLRRRAGLYADASLLAGRVTIIAGLGPTMQLNNVLVGSDKFGHFFSQGFKYYRRYVRSGQYESPALLAYGARVERRFFGALTTGIYSNADLVANYEGMRFYLSLSRATDRPALFAWHGDRPVLQRRFSWRHFVNEYWDEAINASHFNPGLARYLDRRLPEFCAQYRSAPQRFEASRDAELAVRYARIGIERNRDYRISRHCKP